jgi:hypothetical protein
MDPINRRKMMLIQSILSTLFLCLTGPLILYRPAPTVPGTQRGLLWAKALTDAYQAQATTKTIEMMVAFLVLGALTMVNILHFQRQSRMTG